jgi:hypothetical protein
MNGFGLGFNRQRLIGALLTLATALFLMAVAPRFRYRRAARRASIAIYALVVAGVLTWVVLWALGVGSFK